MDTKKFEKILLDKMKVKFPDAENVTCNVELKFGTHEKLSYRIHLMAFYKGSYYSDREKPEYRKPESFHYYAKTIAECFSTCDQLILEYKKTEKLDLP